MFATQKNLKFHKILCWGFTGGWVVKNLPAMQELQETQVGSLSWKDSPGEGNGNLFQCSCFSCLENSRDWAWMATVHGVAELDVTERARIHVMSLLPLLAPPPALGNWATPQGFYKALIPNQHIQRCGRTVRPLKFPPGCTWQWSAQENHWNQRKFGVARQK